MVLRGTQCFICEGELRAIARYGSTVGISVAQNLFFGGRAIARYGSTAGNNEVTNDGQGTTVDDRWLEGLGILDFWGIVGWRGTYCLSFEGELRAIARYGSTVIISAR